MSTTIQPEHMTFGERLRRLRRERRLTQVQLAKQLGTDASYVARLETGKIEDPGLGSLHRLADALDVPVSALVGGETTKASGVEKAISLYPHLNAEAKRTLLRIFRALDEEPKK